MRKVFLVGKITDNENYRAEFAAAEAAIRERGDIPLNPAVLPDGLSQDDYARIAWAMLDRADAVALLPGWTRSHGAIIERALCAYVGKDVFTLDGEVLYGSTDM